MCTFYVIRVIENLSWSGKTSQRSFHTVIFFWFTANRNLFCRTVSSKNNFFAIVIFRKTNEKCNKEVMLPFNRNHGRIFFRQPILGVKKTFAWLQLKIGRNTTDKIALSLGYWIDLGLNFDWNRDGIGV